MAPSQSHSTHHRRPPSRHPDLGVPLFSLAPSPSASSRTARPHGDTDSDSVDDIAEMSLERLALSPPATATTISTTLAPPTPTTPTSSSTATTTHPVVTTDIETAAGVATGAVFTGVGINPPTPAPSPGPHIRGFDDSDTHIREHLEQLIYHGNANTSTDTESQDEEAKAKAHLPDPSPSPSTPTPQTILSQYTSLPPLLRSKFLNLLIPHLALHEALSLSRKIEPLLRRDFLRELPWEVALHVLSFVDDPQTLARAAQVSRYWNTLLQDETTWRDLLARHHHHHHHRYANGSGAGISGRDLPQHARAISREGMERMAGKEEEEKAWDLGSGLGPPAEPIPATNNPHPNTSTNTNTSTRRGTSTSSSLAGTSKQSKARENALGIGSGTNQASCIKRVTPFGLEKRVLNLSSGLTGLPPALPPPISPISPISPSPSASPQYSYKTRVKLAYLTETNWLTAGVLLAKHLSADDSVVTTLSFDETWIVVGMANSKIHVFSAFNGGWKRSLEGRGAHTQGVWAMVLVSPPHQAQTANQMQGQGQDMKRMRGTRGVMGWYGAQASTSTLTPAPASASTSTSPSASPNAWSGLDSPFSHPHPQTQTQTQTHTHTHGRENQDKGQGQSQDESEDENEGGNLCGSVRGWQGLKTSLVVSGGCDKQVKVWDVETGQCIHSLPGHTSTIRCIKVLPHRPIAVSGSRDYTLRVWDIQRGRCLHTLRGHTKSVRCVEVWGNMAVSGSYDNTAKLWNLDTGECLQTFTGHYSQIYSIAFNGSLVITGSLDSTVRVWSPTTGECLALLQGHTALVGQLQLSGSKLVTGGSDGRVIIFDLSSMSCIHRLCAHDNSVTCLQFDKRFIVSGGNDGRVKLWDVKTGGFVRELTKPCDAVWRTSFRGERIVVLCQREGRTCLEVVSFRPGEGEKRDKGR
ncbi:F-box and WD-40 domain-containing protein CDC4 [Cryptococcus neoformans A2-102-5]|nr:F-box and WD-40 domain-containing protein CDC4 [Cryptococcus neoformans var. grubii A2-102-5]